SHAARSTIAPIPATPARMSVRSETAQIATTEATCARRIPCRRTNAFCAPITTMSESPVNAPVAIACSTTPTLGTSGGEVQRMILREVKQCLTGSMDLPPAQLAALVAIADHGSFEAAAKHLQVTPS